MLKNITTDLIYEIANNTIKSKFEYSDTPQEEIDAYREGLIAGMEKMYEMLCCLNLYKYDGKK